jgi:NADH-quinone oxidoreductase subunit A
VTEYYRQYLAVAVFVGAAFLMVAAMLGVGRLIRPRRPQDEKLITYESLLFVIFDVEAVFIFPWAINADEGQLSWYGLAEMFVFIAVLLLGLAYAWRKGLLKWA